MYVQSGQMPVKTCRGESETHQVISVTEDEYQKESSFNYLEHRIFLELMMPFNSADTLINTQHPF